MQTENVVTFTSRITPACFIRFGFFDNYRIREKWKMPMIFSGTFLALSLLAWHLSGKVSGTDTWMKIGLYLAVAIPITNVASLFAGILYQAGKHDLSKQTVNYLVILGPKGIGVVHRTEHANCSWEHIYHVYRVPGCIYLYVAFDKAFLLPEAGNTESAWDMIKEHVEPQKITNLTK